MRKLSFFPPRRLLGAALFAALCAGLLASSASAQRKDPEYAIVFLKDGFAIQGYVKRESAEIEIDPYSKTSVTIPKGFYLLDDGPRRIMFAPFSVGRVDPRKLPADDRVVHNKKFPVGTRTRDVPAILDIVNTTPFDKEWERTFHFRGVTSDRLRKPVEMKLNQHVYMMTPYGVCVDTTSHYLFSSMYLTREFPPEVVTALLSSHPKFVEERNMEPAEKLKRRYAYCEFMAQAGWFDLAEQDLLRSLKDFPDHKVDIEMRLKSVGEIKARENFEQIKRMALAGQHHTVIERIKKFPEKYANEEMLSKLRELKGDYETAAERGNQAKKHLNNLWKEVNGDHRALFREAAEAMLVELCFDNVARLDTFVSQATQYEAKKSKLGPNEVMSLAISSWLLGSAAADPTPETAVRLWKMRKLILEAEKSEDAAERQKLIAAALKDRSDLTVVEEASLIIPSLPPVEAAEIVKGPHTVKASDNTSYDLNLPPEYRHGRHYPVLIVLHDTGEKPRAMMDRWEAAAEENGFILAAPHWENGAKGYTYSVGEHQTVLDTIRDLRRKFRVDSDRVFLFGLRDGGAMAFDVGLSHPDLFAGVSTMGAGPDLFSEVYWRNGQYLPFYVVNGDRVGPMQEKTHKHFENWVGKHFPMLWVQYKGRGAEWFAGEVPMIFEWMRVKRRAFPLHHLGDGGGFGGTEFHTMRTTDNSFYWLTTNSILPIHLNNPPPNWRPVASPARIQATIYPESNDIRVTASPGIKQVSVWLGRNLHGENMIDFSKPVSFRVNNTQFLNKKKIEPSLAVLLEDLHRRGDRQRVYLGRLDATQ